MNSDIARVWINVLLALTQLALPPLLFRGSFNTLTAKPPGMAPSNPATPAGYAFIIWAFIFIGCMVYAVVQALPANVSETLFRRIGWATAGGFALCAAWLFAARYGPVWLTVPIIVGMFACLAFAVLSAASWQTPLSAARYWLVLAPLTLYLGWLSAAMFVNAADVLPGYGFGRFGLTPSGFGVLIVAMAGAVAISLMVFWRLPLIYPLTVTWALVAIAVNARTASGTVAVVSLAASALVPAAWLALRMSNAKVGPV